MLNIQLFIRLILNKIKMDLCTCMRQRSHCDSKVFVYFSSVKFDKAENHHFLFSHWYTWTQAFVLLFFNHPHRIQLKQWLSVLLPSLFSCIPQIPQFICVLFNAWTHIHESVQKFALLMLVYLSLNPNPNSHTQQDMHIINISHYFHKQTQHLVHRNTNRCTLPNLRLSDGCLWWRCPC